MFRYVQYEDPFLGATEALLLGLGGDPRFEFKARRTLHAFLPGGLRAARRAAQDLDAATPRMLLAGVSGAVLACMPFAAGAVLRVNLR